MSWINILVIAVVVIGAVMACAMQAWKASVDRNRLLRRRVAVREARARATMRIEHAAQHAMRQLIEAARDQPPQP